MDATYELECSVIGAVLARPENLALLPTLELSHFHSLKAQVAFEAIRNLEAGGKPIDLVTIGDEIARLGKFDAVGWDFLGQCALQVPTVDNAIEYANRVKDAALRRRLMETFAELIQMGRNGESGAEILSQALAAVTHLDAESPESASTIGDVVKRRMAQLELIAEERRLGHRTLSGFTTGVERLDEKIGGWQPGIVSIVAARPGMGKSSLGLATADAVSRAGFGVHLFSLEDTEEAYADRAMARESGVAAESLRNATLERGHMISIGAAVTTLRRRVGWIIDGRSGITADEIVRSVRRRKRDNGTRVAIVDYVQLVKRPPRLSAHEALSDIVTMFADAAKQDGIAYVVMSQLNREIEKRPDKRPQLSDLRESGSLEERAKCVVGVYRGSAYGKKAQKGIDYADGQPAPTDLEFERMVQLIVLKNSNGRTGCVRATWNGPTTRIE